MAIEEATCAALARPPPPEMSLPDGAWGPGTGPSGHRPRRPRNGGATCLRVGRWGCLTSQEDHPYRRHAEVRQAAIGPAGLGDLIVGAARYPRPVPNSCYICGADDARTRDHVFPRALFTRPLPPEQRRGYATEAARAVAHRLAENGVRTFMASIVHGHEESEGVARKLGMVCTERGATSTRSPSGGFPAPRSAGFRERGTGDNLNATPLNCGFP